VKISRSKRKMKAFRRKETEPFLVPKELAAGVRKERLPKASKRKKEEGKKESKP
jgi:hypothetical protein